MPLPNLTLVSSAARTISGNSDAFDLFALFGVQQTIGLPPCMVVQSKVSAASGTSPTLTVKLQDSVDGGVTWNDVQSLTQQTAVSVQVGRLGLAAAAWPFNARRFRVAWTIGGTTPNFTFAVSAALL